jgi:hypothetical protein
VGKKKDKKSKHTLPKRIAGVKVPKKLRKAGGSALASTPIVSEIIATSLIAAAAALAKTETGGRVARKAQQGLQSLKQDGASGAHDLAGVIGAAITSAVEHWAGGSADDRRKGKRDTPKPDATGISTQH